MRSPISILTIARLSLFRMVARKLTVGPMDVLQRSSLVPIWSVVYCLLGAHQKAAMARKSTCVLSVRSCALQGVTLQRSATLASLISDEFGVEARKMEHALQLLHSSHQEAGIRLMKIRLLRTSLRCLGHQELVLGSTFLRIFGTSACPGW